MTTPPPLLNRTDDLRLSPGVCPSEHAPLSRRRLALALAVAGTADLLSVWCEVALPVEWLLDLATAAALFGILGWRWFLLPALIAEAIPGIAIFPAWVLVVFAVAATDGRSLSPAKDGKTLPPVVQTGAKIMEGVHGARVALLGCAWAAAAVFIVGILTVGFVLLRSCEAPTRLVDRIGAGLRGTFTTHTRLVTIVSSAMGELRHESKIVVCTNQFPVTVTKSSAKSWEILGEAIDLGTTSVSLTAMDNKVQYIIKNPGEITFDLRDQPRELVVTVPSPVLDETLVEVQSNPDQIGVVTETGWARSKFMSGKALEEQIKRELRPLVVQEGRHPARLEKATAHAVRTISDMVRQQLAKRRLDDLSVRVVIQGGRQPPESPLR